MDILFRKPKKGGPENRPPIVPPQSIQEDTVKIELPLMTVSITRKLNIDTPHEVHVLIPRAEIRIGENESEFIYSSITIVHAPRHPLAGEHPPGGENSTPAAANTKTERKSNSTSADTGPAPRINFRFV